MHYSRVASRFLALVVVSGSLLVAGCGPRGESHTVEQILNDARVAYQTSSNKIATGDAVALKSLESSLDKLAGIGGGGDAKVIANDVANTLTNLIVRAGYTARPAMSELINQYRSVAGDKSVSSSIGAPNLKLLAARTYSLIAAELNTTQFKL